MNAALIVANVASIEAVPLAVWESSCADPASGSVRREWALHWARRGYDVYCYSREIGARHETTDLPENERETSTMDEETREQMIAARRALETAFQELQLLYRVIPTNMCLDDQIHKLIMDCRACDSALRKLVAEHAPSGRH